MEADSIASESGSGTRQTHPLRSALWWLGRLLTRIVYRIEVMGDSHVPVSGGALLVPNHLSMIDAFLIGASTGRQVRFLMYHRNCEHWLIRPFARILGVIPISSEQRPRELLQSLRAATEAVQGGELVCLFAEGQMSRTGQMLPFRQGVARIMKGLDAPIVPVCLDGVWGSIFSFEGGRFGWKWPKRLPYRVTVRFGEPLPAGTPPGEIRRAVAGLAPGAFRRRKAWMQPVHRSFIQSARRHPLRFAMGDARTPRLSFIKALAGSILVARRLATRWQGQECVGILLPPSVGGALVNLAALLMGRVPVNLNYTCSESIIAACASQCGIRTVVTSRFFLDKLGIHPPGEVLLLEEVVGGATGWERLSALFAALFAPVGVLERSLGRERAGTLDDLATVIFSSGSTGEPKGVMLSHFNVASNIVQLEQVFRLGGSDRFLGTLPFFHSFGFTGTLCLTSALGLGVAYHPTPLDAAAIGACIRGHRLTFVLTTPTFLQLYARSCAAEDFGSVRVLMTGAEKLSDRLSDAVEEKFGIRPLEGYGCTECAPVVAVNSPDFRAAGLRQAGAKRGTIGHPLPGICIRIVDPATREPVPAGEPGLMLVRGPNVMQGYLGRPDITAGVLLADGDGDGSWYVTGDIVAADEDGFLKITDRLSRFSKIGGEMVPHIKVEETLHALHGSTERVFVVTGLPDERKGERLVVLHVLTDPELKACLAGLAGSDMPNLWKPKADAFVRVDAFPILGTGKLDLQAIRVLAQRATPTAAAP